MQSHNDRVVDHHDGQLDPRQIDAETAAVVDACLRRLCDAYASPVFPDSRYTERVMALADDPQMRLVFGGNLGETCTLLAQAGLVRGRAGARSVGSLSPLASPDYGPTSSGSSTSSASSDEAKTADNGRSPPFGPTASSPSATTWAESLGGGHKRRAMGQSPANANNSTSPQRRPQCHFCHQAHHMADCALFKEARAKYHLRQGISAGL